MLLAWAMILGLCACGSIRRTTAGTPKDFAPLVRFVDVNVGETATATLSNGETAAVKLLAMKNERDPAIRGIWRTTVTVEVNGAKAEIVSGVYNLPPWSAACRSTARPPGISSPSRTSTLGPPQGRAFAAVAAGLALDREGDVHAAAQERMFAGTNWYDNILMSPQGAASSTITRGWSGRGREADAVVAAPTGCSCNWAKRISTPRCTSDCAAL